MVIYGLEIINILVIHPMWVIDEYAIIDRRWDWFIPIIPPHRALRGATRLINISIYVLFRINARIIKGANFCHVVKIIHENQDNDVITGGNQKWNGAIPIFNRIADARIIDV